MKRWMWPFVLLLVCLAAWPAVADMPDLQGAPSSLFETPVYRDIDAIAWGKGNGGLGPEGLAACVRGNAAYQMLFVVSGGEEAWSIDVATMTALHQQPGARVREPFIRLSSPDEGRTLALFQWYDGRYSVFTFVQEGNAWLLARGEVYRQDTSQRVLLAERVPGGMDMRIDGDGESVTVSFGEGLRLDRFCVDLFPADIGEARSMAEAQARLGYPLPAGETLAYHEDTALTLPVYQGPGKAYYRAAQGRASVSTAEPFILIGEEDGWLLIAYRIADAQLRFGYVEKALLPGIEGSPLALASQPAIISTDTALVFDPINLYAEELALPEGTPVTFLGTFGGSCIFVETEIGGRPARGFVAGAVTLAE